MSAVRRHRGPWVLASVLLLHGAALWTLQQGLLQRTLEAGTPADVLQASANPGQAITLVGTGLSTGTDVLLRYVDEGATHLGLVRGVNVDVRFPSVHQTLEVESHE